MCTAIFASQLDDYSYPAFKHMLHFHGTLHNVALFYEAYASQDFLSCVFKQ